MKTPFCLIAQISRFSVNIGGRVSKKGGWMILSQKPVELS